MLSSVLFVFSAAGKVKISQVASGSGRTSGRPPLVVTSPLEDVGVFDEGGGRGSEVDVSHLILEKQIYKTITPQNEINYVVSHKKAFECNIGAVSILQHSSKYYIHVIL